LKYRLDLFKLDILDKYDEALVPFSFAFINSLQKVVFNKEKKDVKNLHCLLRRRPKEVHDICFSCLSTVAVPSISTFCFLI